MDSTERGLVRLLITGILFFGMAHEGSSAYISMDTAPHGFLSGTQVSMLVESVNKGDESALNVWFEVLFPGVQQSSPMIEKLDPKAKTDHAFEFNLPADTKYRQLVVPVITHYTDGNMYPFSSVTRSVVARGTPAAVPFAGQISPVTIADAGNLVVRLQSVDGKSHKVVLRPAFPKEIRAEPTKCEITIPATDEERFTFKIRNFAALPGSTYAIWVIAAEDGAEGIVEDAFVGNVRIDTNRHILLPQWRWGIAGLAILLVGVYVYRLYTDNRTKKSSVRKDRDGKSVT